MMKKYIFYLLAVCFALPAGGQTVTTAVPFLTVNPDVRSAGMGSIGVAARPDVWAAFSNAARYAFMEKQAGMAFSYTPWMKELVEGQNLYALAAFYRPDSKSAVAVSVRYFTLPEFAFWNEQGEMLGSTSPSDFALDAAYTRRFGNHFSAALAIRYIRSGVGEEVDGGGDVEADGAVAGDLSFYYVSGLQCGESRGNWRLGLQLANLGTKISSYGSDTYLPASLKLGGSADLALKERHTISVGVDFSRLLVEENTALKDNSVLSNVFGSFGNRAFFKSVVWSVGAEYDWKKTVCARLGYNHESVEYGDRCYFTLGAGVRVFGFLLDVSWLMPAGDSDAPYKNTWRIGVGYCF